MKILKVIGLFMAIMLLAVLAFQGIANDACRPAEKKSAPVKKEEVKKAEEKTYVIKKGDTFWSIAEKEYGNPFKWINIQKANPELIPEKLPIGKRIIIPVSPKTEKPVIKTVKTAKKKSKKAKAKRAEKTSVKLQTLEVFDISDPEGLLRTLGQKKIFGYKKPGGNRFKGDIIKGLEYLLIPDEPKKLLERKIKGGEYENGWVEPNDVFLMLFGNYQLKLSQNKTGRRLQAKVYSVIYDGYEYKVKWVTACGNPTRYPEVPIPPPEKVEVPVIEKVPPPEEEKIVEIPEKPTEAEIPVQIPEKEEEVLLKELPKIEEKMGIEHEPIFGVYTWGNDLAHGWGGYAEYTAWLRKSYPWGYGNGWSPGAGMYGYYSEGDTETSPHYWWLERGIGPQIGLKYIGETKDGRPWQWQAKLRYVWEHMHGENIAGYEMEQNNTKLGLYTEVMERVNPKWIAGATAEGWYALDRDIKSTWSGDHPQNRTTLALNALAQYKISNDWQVRGSGGPFYQGWDSLWGLRASVEARFKETIMFGPQIAFFPFGLSKIYDGVANAGDLTTLTGFIRVEMGATIRNWDRNVKAQRVKKLDDETYGVVIISDKKETPETLPLDDFAKVDTIEYQNPVPYISPVKTADF